VGGKTDGPTSTRDLTSSERKFVAAMHELAFGRFESVRIRDGAVVLEPWPTAVRCLKFGSETAARNAILPPEFSLKPQIISLFEYVRSTQSGEIRCLEVRHGLPFSAEISHDPNSEGGRRE
jgi:hypothetical protein